MVRQTAPSVPRYTRRPGAVPAWLALWLAAASSWALASGLAAQRSIPPVHQAGTIPAQQAGGTSPAASAGQAAAAYMPYAKPVSIDIPAIGVNSDLIEVGKNPDGSMAVPRAPDFDKPAWYRYSPAPGQYGASVIIGHVDSYANDDGASVFFSLSKLRPGDAVRIGRADGTAVTFRVRAVRDYRKDSLPSGIIYGPATETPELRLITCSGTFSTATHSYDHNVVIYATMTGSTTGG